MARIPIDFFYDPEVVKMIQRRRLSESLKMPVFAGSIDSIPCYYADFTQMYDNEYNIFLEAQK